jgi:hypothetical protein
MALHVQMVMETVMPEEWVDLAVMAVMAVMAAMAAMA